MPILGRWSRGSTRVDALDTVVGPTSTLSGTLRSDGGIRVEGKFEGSIDVAGNVVVAQAGVVRGDIRAHDIVIGGVVEGDIEGTGRLEILASGTLVGDVVVSSFMIDEGGQFQGVSRLRGTAHRKALAPPSGDAPALPDLVVDVAGVRTATEPSEDAEAPVEAEPTDSSAAVAKSEARSDVESDSDADPKEDSAAVASDARDSAAAAAEAAGAAGAAGAARNGARTAAGGNDPAKTRPATRTRSANAPSGKRAAESKDRSTAQAQPRVGKPARGNIAQAGGIDLDIEPIIPDIDASGSGSGGGRVQAGRAGASASQATDATDDEGGQPSQDLVPAQGSDGKPTPSSGRSAVGSRKPRGTRGARKR